MISRRSKPKNGRKKPDQVDTKARGRQIIARFLGDFLAEVLWPLAVIILSIVELVKRIGKTSNQK